MRFSVRIILIMFLALHFLSCSERSRDAKEFLAEAENAYKKGNYTLAKLKIDSIKINFPKSFAEINAGYALMQEIRLSENIRNIAYCDSMLNISYNQLNEMLTKFDFVRDERYQEFGEYYPKIYPHKSSLNQNGLRSGVREKGTLFIESVLSGHSIKHYKVRITSDDGSFAESNSVKTDGLNYTFNTLEKSYEIVRYSGHDENGIAQYIYSYRDKPLTVRFVSSGNRTATSLLSNSSKQAISQSFELSNLLLSIEQLKIEKEKSEVLIQYLKSKETVE